MAVVTKQRKRTLDLALTASKRDSGVFFSNVPIPWAAFEDQAILDLLYDHIMDNQKELANADLWVGKTRTTGKRYIGINTDPKADLVIKGIAY